ncbi:MAG: hypothetical protein MUO85_11145 [candidate division Zixibacteria bacterium]|nr:hypothetical protein [candidate division Zixibacteria bacterium]
MDVDDRELIKELLQVLKSIEDNSEVILDKLNAILDLMYEYRKKTNLTSYHNLDLTYYKENYDNKKTSGNFRAGRSPKFIKAAE